VVVVVAAVAVAELAVLVEAVDFSVDVVDQVLELAFLHDI